MTNAAIIEAAAKLNGITEPAHTFAKWKQLGYSVKKGEHAAFKATIWKAKEREIEDITKISMFMKTANFFTLSQVEPLKDK